LPEIASQANYADWLAALGTLLAVVVALILALFKQDISRLRWRPKLTATIRMRPPDCQILPLLLTHPETGKQVPSQKALYLRLWVENSGRERATYVQVFASELKQKQSKGEFTGVSEFLPMNLRWSHSHEVFAEAISPDMGKHCDLAHVYVLPENVLSFPTIAKPYKSPTVFQLDTEVVPSSLSNILGPGVYRLTLKIAASNAKPVVRELEIDFSGEPFEDAFQMLTKGISVRNVSRQITSRFTRRLRRCG
jgi:hypothetical protein